MPDVNGQYQLQDYIAELQSRGFDQFTVADLTTFINRGYFHVARRSRWFWEQATATIAWTPGLASVDLWPVAGGQLQYFKSLDYFYITTSGRFQRIPPLKRSTFFERYMTMDFSDASNWGTPAGYYIEGQKLYLVRPTNVALTATVHFKRRPVLLVGSTDVPITPADLDEAILLGALMRCHKRAQEPTLAAITESDLEEIFDDMRDEENDRMDELQERVRPDNQWL